MKEELGLDTLKEGFERMVDQATPNLLPLFFTWIDIRISNYRSQSSKISNYLSEKDYKSVSLQQLQESSEFHMKTMDESFVTVQDTNIPPENIVLDRNSSDGYSSPLNLSVHSNGATPLGENKCFSKIHPKCYNTDTCTNTIQIETKGISDETKHNECNICHKQFQYRSSYRRHMKIHQGIFSHLCDICNRKFTRKEHYLRHKCNRRPNKPNRAGYDDQSSGNVTAKEIDHKDIISSSTECTSNENIPKSPKLESRRKSKKPQKVITSATNCSPDGISDSESGDESNMDNPFVSFGGTKKSFDSIHNISWPTHYVGNTPPRVNGSESGNELDESVLTLDSGSYKVQAVSSPSPANQVQDDNNSFIKVVKQGNYLKLKNQMHVVSGKLCFVCPNCNKVFHRSSNFSRHMRIHRGIYSYVCPTCHRGFFRKEHYQKHKCHRKSMSHIWNRKTKIDLDMFAGKLEDNCSSSNNESEIGIDIDPLNESGESQLDNDSGSVISGDGKESFSHIL